MILPIVSKLLQETFCAVIVPEVDSSDISVVAMLLILIDADVDEISNSWREWEMDFGILTSNVLCKEPSQKPNTPLGSKNWMINLLSFT